MDFVKFEKIFKPWTFIDGPQGRSYTFSTRQYLRHKCKLEEYKTIHKNANHVTILIPN